MALWLCGGAWVSGCWGTGSGGDADDAGPSDGGSAGFTGAVGGSAGIPAGFGGEGGFGGAGFGGTSGTGQACPNENPNCSVVNRTGICETLVMCNRIPGAAVSVNDCVGEVSEGCVDCMTGVAAFAEGDGGPLDCAGLHPEACQDCKLLVQVPQTESECLEIAATHPNVTPAYEACLCEMCFDEYATCIGEDGCWRVVHCMYEHDCRGMACFSSDTCMVVIEDAGVTSIGVALATDLGNCTAVTCDPLND